MKVYRRLIPFLVMLCVCILFVGVLILECLGFLAIGWFDRAPSIAYAFLAFLLLLVVWLAYLFRSFRAAVLILEPDTLRLVNVTRPSRSTAIPLSQIRAVSEWWYPDTVPAYLILELEQINESQQHSGVWTKIDRRRLYFECSNLTMNAREIASVLRTRISQVRRDREPR